MESILMTMLSASLRLISVLTLSFQSKGFDLIGIMRISSYSVSCEKPFNEKIIKNSITICAVSLIHLQLTVLRYETFGRAGCVPINRHRKLMRGSMLE